MRILSLALLLIFSGFQFVMSQSDVFLVSGLAKQKEGKHDLAILDFSELIKKHASEMEVYLKKWDELQKFTEFERAEKNLEAPVIDIAFARPYYLRGLSFAAINNTQEALSDFSTAIKINSKLSSCYLERGKLLWTSGKKFEGCSDLQIARSMNDSIAKEMYDEKFCWNEAMGYYKESLSKLKLNQFELAFDLIQKAIQLSPDSALFYVVRGKCYLGLGKLDLSFPDFDKAIKSMPNNSEAYFGRGLAFYNKRKFQEAFDDLDKAIQFNERLVDAYLYRAYSCESLNKVQSALYDYQQVQRMRPYDPLAFYKSGLLKIDNNDPNGACADFKKAASLNHAEAADYVKSSKSCK